MVDGFTLGTPLKCPEVVGKSQPLSNLEETSIFSPSGKTPL